MQGGPQSPTTGVLIKRDVRVDVPTRRLPCEYEEVGVGFSKERDTKDGVLWEPEGAPTECP